MPLAINYSERLITKLDALTLSEKLHKDNRKVASNLQMRPDSGIF